MGVLPAARVVFRPPSLPRPVVVVVAAVVMLRSGLGAMSQMNCLRKKSLGSVMWYTANCSVWARNTSSG